MRITGGSLRGRRLEPPRDPLTRPPLEMLRQALFEMIEGDLQGVHVLDAFAGTGSLGLEALSRGAAFVDLVERSRPACDGIERSAAALGVADRIAVHRRDACRLGNDAFPAGRFAAAFVDAPFEIARSAPVAALLTRVAGRWLAQDGLLVTRWPAHEAPPPPLDGLDRVRERRYGDSVLVIDWRRIATS